MIVNLGLVEMGGSPIEIDDPEFKIDGYVFKFNSKDPEMLMIRGWSMLNALFGNYSETLDVRLFVNYDDQVVISAGLCLITSFANRIERCHLLFDDGRVLKYI